MNAHRCRDKDIFLTFTFISRYQGLVVVFCSTSTLDNFQKFINLQSIQWSETWLNTGFSLFLVHSLKFSANFRKAEW